MPPIPVTRFVMVELFSQAIYSSKKFRYAFVFFAFLSQRSLR